MELHFTNLFVNGFLNAGSLYDTRGFFVKFAKKRYKGEAGKTPYQEFKGIFEKMRKDMLSSKYKSCVNAWNLIVDIAQGSNSQKVMNTLDNDIPESRRVYDMMLYLRTEAKKFNATETATATETCTNVKSRSAKQIVERQVRNNLERLVSTDSITIMASHFSCYAKRNFVDSNNAALLSNMYSLSLDNSADLDLDDPTATEFSVVKKLPYFTDVVITTSDSANVYFHSILVLLLSNANANKLQKLDSNIQNFFNEISSASSSIIYTKTRYSSLPFEQLNQIIASSFYSNFNSLIGPLVSLRLSYRENMKNSSTSQVQIWNMFSDLKIIAFPRLVTANRYIVASRCLTSDVSLKLSFTYYNRLYLKGNYSTEAVEYVVDLLYMNEFWNGVSPTTQQLIEIEKIKQELGIITNRTVSLNEAMCTSNSSKQGIFNVILIVAIMLVHIFANRF